MRLISACLLGINCRYDGRNCINKKVVQLAMREILIPICPEQLGGLGTPREPMSIIGGGGSEVLDGKARVVNTSGEDITKNLVSGSEEVLKIAKLFGVREAVMKAESPSCGCGEIRDGVTTVILKRNGIRVITEEQL